VPQHQSWNNGAMDGFVSSRLSIDSNEAILSMGYYTRADLPYYYALADAFTICDNYFCSVIGPTDPNRLYTMAASLDPDGQNGGPVLQSIVTNRTAFYGRLTYTTMPEQLQARGVSWKVYSSLDETVLGGILSDTVLTSVLRFIETVFGAEVPNLSAWRRATVGDLTSALNFTKPEQSIPNPPSTLPAVQQAILQCAANLAGTTPYTVQNAQTFPTQESGTAIRPSGVC
jgi:phospholipase C